MTTNSAIPKSVEETNNPNTGTCRETANNSAKQRFYGQAEHRSNGGIFSSLLKRKVKKLSLPSEVKEACQSLEAYKLTADRLHQALMFMLIENTEYSMKLDAIEPPQNIEMDEPYGWVHDHLYSFDACQKKGCPGNYEDLKPAMEAFKKLDQESKDYVRKQIITLQPFTTFIGLGYWGYVKLRKIHWESMETCDLALTTHNKERTEETEKAILKAQKARDENKAKLLDCINELNSKKPTHVDAVLKFTKEAANFHTRMAAILADFNMKEPQQSSTTRGKTKESAPPSGVGKVGE